MVAGQLFCFALQSPHFLLGRRKKTGPGPLRVSDPGEAGLRSDQAIRGGMAASEPDLERSHGEQ